MVAKVLVSPEEYLSQSHSDVEPDYLDGEVLERGLPNKSHSSVQFELSSLFAEFRKQHPLHPMTELRMKVSPTQFRVADLAVFAPTDPAEEVPSEPPLLVVEIVSPDDRYEQIMIKLGDYQNWGVPHIWLADPPSRRVSIYRDGALTPMAVLALPEFGIAIQTSDIFRTLPTTAAK